MKIITLTINPALDKSAKIDELAAFEKLECHEIDYHPGGGGINISRVLHRLNISSHCLFPFGGKTGEHIIELLEEENIEVVSTSISTLTRENFAVVDEKTGLQYRFGMPTMAYQEKELLPLEKWIGNEIEENDIFIISGSLPRGLPTNYYSKLVEKISKKNVKIIVDTSGEPFKEVLTNPLYLIKPNQSELAKLAGKTSLTYEEQKSFALKMVAEKRATYVVVSLGKNGAFIAHKNGVHHIKAPSLKVNSTIGAGDSMVAGLIYGIVNNQSPENTLRFGVACGVAATMSEGSDLAHKENIEKVLEMI